MMLTGTREECERHPLHFALQVGDSTKNVYFSSSPDERPSPNAYLVKQSPDSVLKAHFHHASQFQVIVHGNGRIGRHNVEPVTVHYAGQQTAYGPLVAGSEGLWYLTLRAVTESGAWFMPESAKIADHEIPRNYHITEPQTPSTDEVLATGGEVVETELLSEASGLGSWILRIPPHTKLPPLPAFTGNGRYYIVIGGGLVSETKPLPPLSVVWASDEVDIQLTADAGGAEVLIVQFPEGAWKFETRPLVEPEMKTNYGLGTS
jgi:hypothetical protein